MENCLRFVGSYESNQIFQQFEISGIVAEFQNPGNLCLRGSKKSAGDNFQLKNKKNVTM